MANNTQNIHDLLVEIVAKKREELELIKSKSVIPTEERVEGSHTCELGCRRFFDSPDYIGIAQNDIINIIAELKFASPTRPHLGDSTTLLTRAKEYEAAGADMISIITEKHFFKGDPDFVTRVKHAVSLPILQKDFVIDPVQIYQAKELGSDALLLIARLVEKQQLQEFVALCFSLGIEPVVEINDEEDLAKALAASPRIIAVNARDLRTFAVDVERACRLISKIPSQFIRLGFSGIKTAAEVKSYCDAGANGVLVGTSLMEAKDPAKFLRHIRVLPESPSHRARSGLSSSKELRAFGNPSDSVTPKCLVKICGMQRYEDAQVAVAAGADFIGFVFVKGSSRYIHHEDAKNIAQAVRGKVKIVGVFQDASVAEVNWIAELVGLDFVQLHGEEDLSYREKISIPVIQKVSISGLETLVKKNQEVRIKNNGSVIHNSSFILLDRNVQGQGEMIDLSEAQQIAQRFPTFYAGGLTPKNVAEVVSRVQPFAVDVSGGVRTKGIIDKEKVKLFVSNVHVSSRGAK